VGEIMVAEEWAPVKGAEKDYWKPEKKGEERIGTVLRMEAEAGKYKGTQYVLDVGDGKECYTPNHAVLNKKLILVKVGSRVKIIYQGTGEKRKKNQNAAELYDVFVSNAPRQAGLGETSPAIPPVVPQADRIKKILEDLTFGQVMFPGHVIPESNIKAACGDEATFKHLKDAGLICMSDSADAPKGVQCWRVMK